MKKVLFPLNVEEMWSMWQDNPEAGLLAGGTDLLVKLRSQRIRLKTIICLEKVKELQQINTDGAQIFIGAMTNHQQLLENQVVKSRLGCLHQAAAVLGSPPIRHMGTIGGNICTASPAGDTLPPLYVLQANLELVSPTGSRIVPIEEFIYGPGKTALAPMEVLKQVIIDLPVPGIQTHYHKVGQRKALAISVCSLACYMQLAPDGSVGEARLAWGSVGPTVMRFPEVEALLYGRKISLDILRQCGELASQKVTPISDVRAGAEYRRRLTANLLIRLLPD
ncbi:MAG: FAD binding domain-containing protein [Syntrophomonas sp.]|nr:FAD binding domain-containing protein [Syntrophomonas sp.]